jgi:hypothetical protein
MKRISPMAGAGLGMHEVADILAFPELQIFTP